MNRYHNTTNLDSVSAASRSATSLSVFPSFFHLTDNICCRSNPSLSKGTYPSPAPSFLPAIIAEFIRLKISVLCVVCDFSCVHFHTGVVLLWLWIGKSRMCFAFKSGFFKISSPREFLFQWLASQWIACVAGSLKSVKHSWWNRPVKISISV